METPPKGYFRLFPGNKVRLRYGYVVECTGYDKDAERNVTRALQLRSRTRSSGTPGADTVQGEGQHPLGEREARATRREVRLYDRLFNVPHPGAGDADFLKDLNPDSKKVITAQLEPALQRRQAGRALPVRAPRLLRRRPRGFHARRAGVQPRGDAARFVENMKLAAFEAIAAALRDADVRYLVAGGLAVNAHGYLRLTHDVDLVIQLKPDNIRTAFAALAGLGYRPNVPVAAGQFADEKLRAQWIREKGMQVLNFHSERHRPVTVDVFVTEPFDFDLEYGAAMQGELAQGLVVRFVSISTLIAMKQLANRPRDLDDIEHLRMIIEEKRRDESSR